MEFQENKKIKINNSRTMRALFRANEVSIDYLKMDYKRSLCLSCSPEAQGLVNPLQTSYNSRGTVYDRILRKYRF